VRRARWPVGAGRRRREAPLREGGFEGRGYPSPVDDPHVSSAHVAYVCCSPSCSRPQIVVITIDFRSRKGRVRCLLDRPRGDDGARAVAGRCAQSVSAPSATFRRLTEVGSLKGASRSSRQRNELLVQREETVADIERENASSAGS